MFLTRLGWSPLKGHFTIPVLTPLLLFLLLLLLPPPCLCTVSLKNVYNMIVPCIHRRSHSCILNVNTFLLINSNERRKTEALVVSVLSNILGAGATGLPTVIVCVVAAEQTSGSEKGTSAPQIETSIFFFLFRNHFKMTSIWWI